MYAHEQLPPVAASDVITNLFPEVPLVLKSGGRTGQTSHRNFMDT